MDIMTESAASLDPAPLLLEAHPWLPLADPQACTALDLRVQAIADESASGVLLSPRSRRELSAVHYRLSNRT